MKVYLVVSILFLVKNSSCDTKVWLHSADIYDPKNWENDTVQKTCNGLIFAEANDDIIVPQLNVKSLTLPWYAGFFFRPDSKIVFDENSKGDLNCVKLKPLVTREWHNISEWHNIDDPDNPAVPYHERLPSLYDDVVLPHGIYSGIVLRYLQAKSITIGQDKDQIRKLSYDIELKEIFDVAQIDHDGLTITNAHCEDVTGCLTGLESQITPEINNMCAGIRNPTIECQEPIKPIGFCNMPRCGASIIIENWKTGFKLDKIKENLKKYRSYTHASKVSPTQIQIVFAEKQFSGESLVEAHEFYYILREDPSYFCGNVTLQSSGAPLNQPSAFVLNALSITFGTLLAVIATFGLLFLVFSPAVANLHIRNRLLGNRPLSTYILRYDNIEDRGYIVEDQSAAGSVMNLNRSFENPLFEQASSSGSTSQETIASAKFSERQDDSNEKTIKEVDADLEEAQELSEIDVKKEVEDGLLKDI